MTVKRRTRARRIPERTCVVCGARRDKRTLVRIARLVDHTVAIDETGKGPGRGAYVCHQRTCWDNEQLERRVGHALKTTLTDADRARLESFAAQLPEDAEGD